MRQNCAVDATLTQSGRKWCWTGKIGRSNWWSGIFCLNSPLHSPVTRTLAAITRERKYAWETQKILLNCCLPEGTKDYLMKDNSALPESGEKWHHSGRTAADKRRKWRNASIWRRVSLILEIFSSLSKNDVYTTHAANETAVHAKLFNSGPNK